MDKDKNYNKLGMRNVSIVLFILLILVTACKDSSKKSDKIVIGFSQGLGNHPWRQAMNHSMEIQASLHSNVQLTILDEILTGFLFFIFQTLQSLFLNCSL